MDVYATFGAVWVGANLLTGLSVVAVVVWNSRRYAERMKRSSLLERLLRDIAGHNLAAATGFLRSLTQSRPTRHNHFLGLQGMCSSRRPPP